MVEIKYRIAPVTPDSENFRSEAVNRIAHNIEADADILHDLRLAQHAQRGLHQRVLFRHAPPGFRPGRLPSRLAHQQQPEGERLRKGG